MESKEKEPCPTCGGSGYVYQIDATLDGGVFQKPPKGSYSQKVTCPRCGGKGAIIKVVALVLVLIAAYLYLT